MLKLSLQSLLAKRNLLFTTSCDGEEKPTLEKHVGNTPLIYLKSLSEATGCNIYGKAEFMNPSGSVKDRAAKQMVHEAESAGLLKSGGTIIEGTGGNTGIALAAIGTSKGYKVILCMPNIIAKEKVQLAERFGAQVYLQPLVPFTNDENYAKKAASLGKTTPNSIHTDQFENLANYRAHFTTTGPEIWRQTDGRVDAFITSAGTGGTLAGISSFLKQASNGRVKCYLIDPLGSILYNFVENGRMVAQGSSEIEGIGIGRITANFKQGELDGAVRGTDIEAINMAYYMMRNEGLCLGPSAALNCVGAVKAARKLGPGHTVVTILCDSGERYSSKIYNDEWLAKHNLMPTSTSGKDVAFVE